MMLGPAKAFTKEKATTILTQSNLKTNNLVPYLTKQNEFIYVDKISLAPQTNQKYRSATGYTSTGYAVVVNEENDYAVIDSNQKVVLKSSTSAIDIKEVNGLTFYRKRIEYDKKMPFWNWEWNILSSGVTKKKRYVKTEVGVLESNQILLQKDVSYLNEGYYLDMELVYSGYLFWNRNVYEINKNSLKKVDQNVLRTLNNERYLKQSTLEYSICHLAQKKPLHKQLYQTEMLRLSYNGEIITLKNVNSEGRSIHSVPKLLFDETQEQVYVFPEYEKSFPKVITQATQEQIEFIKKVRSVYSIPNSPYFLLGGFDSKIVDWLYLDEQGRVVESIEADANFIVVNPSGSIIWPDHRSILPASFWQEYGEIKKIYSYKGTKDFYFIQMKDGETQKVGLWNKQTSKWEIEPIYYNIVSLDDAKQIFSIQKNENDLLQLYDNINKQVVGSQLYSSIFSSGLVQVRENSGSMLQFYIDLYSGLEYREQ